jgi:ATP-dependent DNA helicase DinG
VSADDPPTVPTELPPPPPAATVAGALDRVTAALAGGEVRTGQREMAQAVARAVATGRHLIVQAGTGTGKSLAYLVPLALSGRTVVVATATKALQDQLATKDLPFLRQHLDRPFSFAVLKGRANYLCRQRLHEATTSDEQLGLDLGGDRDEARRRRARDLVELTVWAAETETGDRAELPREPSAAAWAAVSVGPRECPGAAKCPHGHDCFAERARAEAAKADVIVVNLHLYGLDLAAGGGILPEHDVVVIDEAHQLEDTISATAGVELGAGRFGSLAAAVGAIVADPDLLAALDRSAAAIDAELGEHLGRRLRRGVEPELATALTTALQRIEAAVTALRAIAADAPGDAGARRERALRAATALAGDIQVVLELGDDRVAWVEGTPDRPLLKVAPLDVAPVLDAGLWNRRTAVLTSATIPPHLAERLGLAADDHDELDVRSPFDHATQALLYCAAHLPNPRTAEFDEAAHREMEALMVAAGGRTLALFTSFRAMDLAADALRPRLPWTVLTQRDLPKAALLRTFTEDETSCLFATMSFWQGVDVPGPALSLVVIDRLPFPRPDEPLLQARRELARAEAFRVVDLPRAATLLAQGVGRLMRRADDTGVVAVLDPRLATSARYRWDIIRALPPMNRTKDRAEAERRLRAIRDRRAASPPAAPSAAP